MVSIVDMRAKCNSRCCIRWETETQGGLFENWAPTGLIRIGGRPHFAAEKNVKKFCKKTAVHPTFKMKVAFAGSRSVPAVARPAIQNRNARPPGTIGFGRKKTLHHVHRHDF